MIQPIIDTLPPDKASARLRRAFPKVGPTRRAACGRSLTLGKAYRVVRAISALALLLLLAPFSIDASAQAGYVHALSGMAFIPKTAAGTALKVGDTFAAGTSLATGQRGRLVLKFADGQLLVLGPSSVLRVDRYHYDARNIKASGFAVGLLTGSMRFVAGSIAAQNRNAVQIAAGSSSITLLSDTNTDFSVIVDTRITGREAGVAAVATGEIAVRTPYGPIRRIAADQAVPWRPSRGEPPDPVPLAAAPAVTQAGVAALRVAALPPNTPVQVDTAASAARAEAAVATARRGSAGTVDALSGDLSVERTNDCAALKAGDRFAPDTLFSTGNTGRVVLKFTDGQTVTLGPNSNARVNNYNFDPQDINASGFELTVLEGSFRLVAGSMASQDPATVGIGAGESYITLLKAGGADFSVVVDPKAPGGEVGVAAVAKGAIAVRTPYGMITRIEANEAVPWQPGQETLPPPTALAALPLSSQTALAALQDSSDIGALLEALPATAAGPAPTEPPVLVALAPSPFPGTSSAFTVTPAVTGCLLSPC